MGYTMKLRKGQLTSARGLCAAYGIHIITAQRWLHNLKQAGYIYVHSWLPDSLGRDAIPIYKVGKGADAPRRKKTHAEVKCAYRQRKKNAGT